MKVHKILAGSIQRKLFQVYRQFYKEVEIGGKVTICKSDSVPLNVEMYVIDETMTDRMLPWGKVIKMKAFILARKKNANVGIVAVPHPIGGCPNQFCVWSLNSAKALKRKEVIDKINAEVESIEKQINSIITGGK